MPIRHAVKNWLKAAGISIHKFPKGIDLYDRDGLQSLHNHSFMNDPDFQNAYRRGVAAAGDLNWHWRVHIGLWAAHSASKLQGDFVECGVNRGFLSSAIMEDLNWDSLGKIFYLLDTFAGYDERFLTDQERASGAMERSKEHLEETGFYVKGVDAVRENFSEWKNLQIIQGAVPETLSEIDANRIAYLHLDMNCTPPEVAAFELLWDRLTPGAFLLFDDYAYVGYEDHHRELDAVAKDKGVRIASLPTGQGLVIKPS